MYQDTSGLLGKSAIQQVSTLLYCLGDVFTSTTNSSTAVVAQYSHLQAYVLKSTKKMAPRFLPSLGSPGTTSNAKHRAVLGLSITYAFPASVLKP